MDTEKDLQYYQGLGRRKRASARVRLYPGTGKFTVNDLPMEEYFTRVADQRAAALPLETAGLRDSMNVSVKVQGGGVGGQAGAVSMGIARAISHRDDDISQPEQRLRPLMRRGGFLTRDPREKERKKAGLKRARKAPQYTKR
ncbi:MAG TPA: 30S ribosomal protein S9 [Anaerolineae bacterium]|nr:30S ribosomal protein S9 [Anaerolineae bacterium]HNU04039.1 30S ribosomal protein S9 [Anaerolineae bacterium]